MEFTGLLEAGQAIVFLAIAFAWMWVAKLFLDHRELSAAYLSSAIENQGDRE